VTPLKKKRSFLLKWALPLRPCGRECWGGQFRGELTGQEADILIAVSSTLRFCQLVLCLAGGIKKNQMRFSGTAAHFTSSYGRATRHSRYRIARGINEQVGELTRVCADTSKAGE